MAVNRASQVVMEVLTNGTTNARASQVVMEVLMGLAPVANVADAFLGNFGATPDVFPLTPSFAQWLPPST